MKMNCSQVELIVSYFDDSIVFMHAIECVYSGYVVNMYTGTAIISNSLRCELVGSHEIPYKHQ